MAERKTDAERLADLEVRMAALKARADGIKARQQAEARKLDTRRKVLLGGMLLERAKADPRAAEQVRRMIAAFEREADRKAFDGFEVPTPPSDPRPQRVAAPTHDGLPPSAARPTG
jgi:hypothetical protein